MLALANRQLSDIQKLSAEISCYKSCSGVKNYGKGNLEEIFLVFPKHS